MSSSSPTETIIQHPAPTHRHPISRIIDWDIVSPRAQPAPLFDTTAWEESASEIFAFDNSKGEFVNPFSSSPASSTPRPTEVQDTLREIDDLINEFMGWKSMLISSRKRNQEEVSPKTKGTEWIGIPKADSPILGVSSQASLLPSHSSSLEVEADLRSESRSLWSISDGTSVYSQLSPSPSFPFLPLKFTLNLPALRRREKMPNLRKDYSSQSPNSPLSSIHRKEKLSPIAITANYASSIFSPDLLTSSPSTSLSPFPSFLREMDIDSLLADHSSEAYTFEDHDDWKGEADIFTLTPRSLLVFSILRGRFQVDRFWW